MLKRSHGVRTLVVFASASLCAVGATAGLGGVAYGATLNVPCDVPSLISAVQHANAAASPTTLSLASFCTYQLTAVNNPANGGNGLPVVTTMQPVTIRGNGATITRVVTAPAFRILAVGTGANVSIDRVTISGGLQNVNGGCRGFLPSACGGGALVLAGGTLRASATAFTSNTVSGTISPSGGGIANLGTLVLDRSLVQGNVATTAILGAAPVGGGLWNRSSGSIQLNRSNILSNSITASQGSGAGINNEGGSLFMQTTQVASNTINASGGHGPLRPNARASGGGIQNDGTLDATVILVTTNSVSMAPQVGAINNVACGGGIDGVGTLNLNRSQLVRNSTGGGADAYGGGIGYGGPVTLTDTTVSFNTAATSGGGINQDSLAGTLTLVGSVVSNNSPNDIAANTC